ncbi:hypothetical protein RND71_039658 [Anisodus tanguticus]|uniref:Uncharacterized protein n=1 Tax=Anisodus tanguticus TaxID=243964 RepID=A0AAE1QZK7_9SOLA|nr:hypothetical protein RND71_039658 [Anisodus tanguticus]
MLGLSLPPDSCLYAEPVLSIQDTVGDNPSVEAHPTNDSKVLAKIISKDVLLCYFGSIKIASPPASPVGIHRDRVEESLAKGIPTNDEEFHDLRASLLRLSKEIMDSPVLATTYNDMALALNDLFALHRTVKDIHDEVVAALQHLGSLRHEKNRIQTSFNEVVWELDQKVGSERLAKLENEWTVWKSHLVQAMLTITTTLPADPVAELSADTLMDLQSEAIATSVNSECRSNLGTADTQAFMEAPSTVVVEPLLGAKNEVQVGAGAAKVVAIVPAERARKIVALELVIRASNKVVYTGQFYIVFPKLECLAHLESLVVRFPLIWFCIVLPFDFSFPSNIKVLKLVSDLLTAEVVATIAGLPNLEILILKLVSFEQQMWGSRDTWDVGDIVFPVLKILKLKHLMIYKWNASETLFPILEQLVIRSCSHLEKIPPSFANILTLETIKLIHCNKYSNSLESSALKIKEEVESRTGYEVQVLITRRTIFIFIASEVVSNHYLKSSPPASWPASSSIAAPPVFYACGVEVDVVLEELGTLKLVSVPLLVVVSTGKVDSSLDLLPDWLSPNWFSKTLFDLCVGNVDFDCLEARFAKSNVESTSIGFFHYRLGSSPIMAYLNQAGS